MKQIGRRGIIILGLTMAASLPIGILGRLFRRQRLRFPYLTRVLTVSEYEAMAAKPGWKASRIVVASGITLNGLVRRPTSRDAPWVLFYQGNDARMLQVGQEFLLRLAADHDWGLAIYAYRGYDSSSGQPGLTELAADSPAILQQLCVTENIDRSRIHLIGFSIGGHLAVRAMGALARLQPRPVSLTLLAPVDDIVMVRRSFYERLDSGDEFQTQPFLAAIPAPVLVIQGAADEALPGPAQGRAIATTLGTRARYVEIPDLGHVAMLDSPIALEEARNFIDANS